MLIVLSRIDFTLIMCNGTLVEPARILAPSLKTSDLIRRDFKSRSGWGGKDLNPRVICPKG
jgi:hypothetical protein